MLVITQLLLLKHHHIVTEEHVQIGDLLDVLENGLHVWKGLITYKTQ